jgi:hypothetical protein
MIFLALINVGLFILCLGHTLDRFEEGPRIPGANYWDMDDIATSKELFPELNPKGLRVMFPPKVRSLTASGPGHMCLVSATGKNLMDTTFACDPSPLYHPLCRRWISELEVMIKVVPTIKL